MRPVLLALVTAAVPLLPAAAADAPRPPNVVVVLADDLGYGDLGCFGSQTIRTPNLDALARAGAKLTDFSVTHPYCTPTRAALLTGRHPIRTGMTRVLWPHSQDGLDESEVTLAELLKAKGYATACFGKWHLGSTPDRFPTKHGFDEWFGMPWPNDQDDTHFLTKKNNWNWGPLPLYRGGEVVEKPAKRETLTERYFAEANRFIAANKAKPFFVYVPTSMPHLWLAATEKFRGKSKHGLYGDTIEEIDHHVGELLATLKKHDLEQNTIVVFFSDNGPVTSHPQLDPKDPKGSAGPFKLGKGTTWEGGVRVPCVVRWPGVVPAGTEEKTPTVVMDLFATLAKAAGCPLPKDVPIDGRDLAPLFAGKPLAADAALYLYKSETLEAVRLGTWKLKAAEKVKGKEPAPEWLLFDLSTDPGEATDVSEKFPDRVKELRTRMAAWKQSLGTLPKPKV